MPDNKVFDQDKNVDIHLKQLETISRSTDIGSQTLKVLTSLIEILTNLSPTNLPTIASKIGGLANPLAEGVKQVAENKIDLAKNKIEIPKLIGKEELENLDKTNPIKSELGDVDYNEDIELPDKNNISDNIKGGLS